MSDAGGRPRKPTKLKVLHGDRADRINAAEPVPAAGEVSPPWELSAEAAEIWERLAPDRIAKGVLTPWDVDAFALFCEALVVARGKGRRARRTQKPGAASPIQEFRAAVSVVSTLGGRFGWTPADRAKLTQEEGRGGAEDLLSG